MNTSMELKRIKFGPAISVLVPLLLFWVVLSLRVPYPITFHFHSQSAGLFAVILLLYYFSLRLPENRGVLVGLGLTMLLFALALSYIWTSGFSDNFISGSLLPYKDAKNYYLGANLILNGLPVEKAGQAVERPLFPGFLASLLTMTGRKGRKRFSMKAAAYAFIVVLAGYFLVNTIYARLLGIPPGSAFGNFSYAL